MGASKRCGDRERGSHGRKETSERTGAKEGPAGPGSAPVRPLGGLCAGPGSGPGPDRAVSCRPGRPDCLAWNGHAGLVRAAGPHCRRRALRPGAPAPPPPTRPTSRRRPVVPGESRPQRPHWALWAWALGRGRPSEPEPEAGEAVAGAARRAREALGRRRWSEAARAGSILCGRLSMRESGPCVPPRPRPHEKALVRLPWCHVRGVGRKGLFLSLLF